MEGAPLRAGVWPADFGDTQVSRAWTWFVNWLLGRQLGTIPRWSERRRQAAERATWDYLGVRPVLDQEWWRRYYARRKA